MEVYDIYKYLKTGKYIKQGRPQKMTYCKSTNTGFNLNSNEIPHVIGHNVTTVWLQQPLNFTEYNLKSIWQHMNCFGAIVTAQCFKKSCRLSQPLCINQGNDDSNIKKTYSKELEDWWLSSKTEERREESNEARELFLSSHYLFLTL